MPQFFTLPKPPPTPTGTQLPAEAPNRPLGQDWLGDAVDVILGGMGLQNPFNPSASKATQIGGMVGAAIPLGMASRIPGAVSETRMGELMKRFGGTTEAMPAARTAAQSEPVLRPIATTPPSVTLDPQTMDILKKYGIALPFAGAAAALGPQGHHP